MRLGRHHWNTCSCMLRCKDFHQAGHMQQQDFPVASVEDCVWGVRVVLHAGAQGGDPPEARGAAAAQEERQQAAGPAEESSAAERAARHWQDVRRVHCPAVRPACACHGQHSGGGLQARSWGMAQGVAPKRVVMGPGAQSLRPLLLTSETHRNCHADRLTKCLPVICTYCMQLHGTAPGGLCILRRSCARHLVPCQ